MYVTLRKRCRDQLDGLKVQLSSIAMDPRSLPGIASELRLLKSSASTPSLRSRESELVEMGRSTSETGAANVRVVVRVRDFLPRGEIFTIAVFKHAVCSLST